MTRTETTEIMSMLVCYYRLPAGVEAGVMASAWHEILKPYAFVDVRDAIVEFARSDKRDYPTFPSPAQIVGGIKTAEQRSRSALNRIRNAMVYGKAWGALAPELRTMISEEDYIRIMDKWPVLEMVDQADLFELDIMKAVRERMRNTE